MPTPAPPTGEPAPLVLDHSPWATPLRRPRMANEEDRRPGLALTNRWLERDGRPFVPVSGEVHYSRLPRERWGERLRAVRAGGVTVVSTYVVWLHHEPERGRASFAGNLDLAAFVDECERTGLDVVLRIGPWVHGETRNGGFPDWVQSADVAHRTDDPGYLELVREWFGRIGRALGGRARAEGGPVLAVQLENELYDQPQHLVTLKRLARRAGVSAPLWTATAWGGARLPEGEVLPLYGGYGDGFWVDAGAPWDPTFREHFFFSHVWDDPGIGADVRERTGTGGASAAVPRSPSVLFPPATCELGGGMATAYHRRPRPAALDVAAVAHCKIGNGSAWQGYYMYAGGTNPVGTTPGGVACVDGGGTQESHATGYPNDVPRLGYDFHAPVGESGTLAPSHGELRRQHAFLAAFGERLAAMPSSLPQVRPAGVQDTATLRWAVRADADRGEGFLFVSWHQPHVPLAAHPGARFRVRVGGGPDLVLPSRGVEVPAGTLARWPFRLELGGARVEWATASALTVLPGAPHPVLVLTAEEGVPCEVAVSAGSVLERADGTALPARGHEGLLLHDVTPGGEPLRLRAPGGALDLLVLPAATARDAWVVEPGTAGAQRRLLLSAAPLAWGADGAVTCRETGDAPDVRSYDAAARAFRPVPLERAGPPARSQEVPAAAVREPSPGVPVLHGEFAGRASAPSPEDFEEHAAVLRLALPAWVAEHGRDPLLHVDWAGDVAELRVDGRTVTDRFWDGSRWSVSLRDAGVRATSEVTLHLLPLAVGAPVHLPADAAARLAGAEKQLWALDAVRVEDAATWTEPAPAG
ncbi:beta-galactosidase [Kineococcus auxinigenes]|uniref:beta-galactosidase n=1 Tax=unclassified Kineococcus TaxID=2621656 RepID=UPI003D7CD1A7